MKRYQTFSVLVWLSASRSKNPECTLYARVTVDGKRAEISLRRKIKQELWDEKAARATGRTDEAYQVNNFLDLVKGKINQHYYELLASNATITAEAIKIKYLGIEQTGKTFLEVFKYHNEQMFALIGWDIAIGTYKRYKVAIGKLERFIKATYRKSDVPLTELKYSFIADFEYYLKTEDKIDHNTAIRYIKIVKKIANVAVRNEWLAHNPFQAFKCTTKEVNRGYLSEDELETIMNKALPSKRLEEVRDIFIFGCYTGYAYAEVEKLSEDHISFGIDGQKWVHINRTKTKNKSNVPLLPVPLALIAKYKEHPESKVRERIFPVKSNQKVNDYLKEIAAICGINKKLTFHIARHTFATTVTLANNVPIESVSTMLGHNSIRTTQIYAKVIEKKVSSDMADLRNKLNVGKRMEQSINQIDRADAC